MGHSLTDVARMVVGSLSEEERRGSAVYVDPGPLEAGSEIPLRDGGIAVAVRSFMAFVDLQPAANWGHPCRYVLVGVDDGSIKSHDARFPPNPESLRLAHRGPGVEEWMLLSARPIAKE